MKGDVKELPSPHHFPAAGKASVAPWPAEAGAGGRRRARAGVQEAGEGEGDPHGAVPKAMGSEPRRGCPGPRGEIQNVSKTGEERA